MIHEKIRAENNFLKFVFFFQKCEKELCVKKELAEWIEFVYGTPDKALRKRLGLPHDKYDAALMSWKVIHENEHPIKKHIQMALLGDL